MELSKQVCNLELAKKLKELGVPQESLFYWEKIQRESFILSLREKLMEIVDESEEGGWTFLEEGLSKGDVYSAFTVAELGEMLPFIIKEYRLAIWREESSWKVFYGGEKCALCEFEENNLSDSMSKMLAYLKENKLI